MRWGSCLIGLDSSGVWEQIIGEGDILYLWLGVSGRLCDDDDDAFLRTEWFLLLPLDCLNG